LQGVEAFHYAEAAAQVLIIVVTVMVIDIVGAHLRRPLV
jgi:ABC-type phosphate/phosphonate transport system permease subunit